MRKLYYLTLFTFLIHTTQAQKSAVEQVVGFTDKNYASLDQLYKHLHQNPELSSKEEKTSALIAEELKKLGFEVQEKLGMHNLAGVLRNGEGPTLLIRADMDALPLEEKTGLPYASKAKGINPAGEEVPVMHACGHDIHMTVFIGTARALVETRKQWKGTLVMVAQSAEETGFGADALFKANLYEKIPLPDYAIALHDNASLPAGTIGYRAGNFMASVDMVDITVHGEGGHGAAPHTTKDPIVLSAEMINAFQTIVSREINPIEPAVVTVGSIHGGTVHNIIPDQVKMQLTLRSYSQEVRDQTIAALHRITANMASMAGLPKEKYPEISIRDPQTPATLNDPELTARLVNVFRQNFGEDKVVETPPNMVGEDFSRFGLQEKEVPICMFWLGAVNPAKIEAAKANGTALPSLHSPNFAPLPELTIKTGIRAMSAAALELLD
ncbi:amidohydrolase [Catalinimonas niigatensis]|uniref:amidohydrolase n=1 Tax=Catalinimonas niigatensis TaxID=1397264 RepID=UPI002665E78A|nr:amidohydrolase [Catalinimonas niigatensis]WPP50526.1 amidohydrolase [Catalinimonas niigatensis]